MTPERLGATICLVAVIAIAVARLPSAIRDHRARPSWAAVVVGCGAFVSTGAAIPLESLDAAIGGVNFINLVQNALAVVAFWLLLEAAKARRSGEFTWRRSWQLPVMIASFAAPFMLIRERQGTSLDFINVYANQWALWAYASIYMSWVVVLVVLTIVETTGHRSRMYIGIRAGCVLVAGGSVAEIVYLTLRAAGSTSTGIVEVLRVTFIPLFYGGVAAIAAGLAGFWLVRIVRSLVLRTLRIALLRESGPGTPEPTGNPAIDAYRLAVALVDTSNTRGLRLWERRLLALTTWVLDRQTMAPRIVKMTVRPSEGLS